MNAAADKNMWFMFVTLLTSHLPMGWLNAVAESNIAYMSVTPLVQVVGVPVYGTGCAQA